MDHFTEIPTVETLLSSYKSIYCRILIASSQSNMDHITDMPTVDGGGVLLPTPGDFRLRWDVFLSFRGTDTRYSFIEDLYDALQSRVVRVFRDDDGLERGDEIAPSLLEAIEDSAASIVVLSRNYASSHWCLEELAKICDCGRLILPVFYCVDPSDVRHQKGPFEEAFKAHEKRFEKDEILRWRKAMKKVGGIAGWVFNDGTKSNLIRLLVQTVLKQLSNTPLNVAPYSVGLDKRVEELEKLLDVKSNDVKVLGLYGMGGIGKTTLAKALFNSAVGHFRGRSFVSNVREISSRNEGLVSLQKTLISQLSPEEKLAPVNDIDDGIATTRRIVQKTRVLIILDDVDNVNQLNALIGQREWFNIGSRIVITTRDKRVLSESNVDMIYEVKELNSSEALELFSYHALRKKKPADNFLNRSEEIVSLTGGLPLALEVFGSLLFDKRTIKEWDDALAKLKGIRPGHLQAVLKISYDGLDEQEKRIFLDIACLFVPLGMYRDDVIEILRGCGLSGEVAISVLKAKCLIKIIKDNALEVHDQLRDMGRQIVLNENLVDPGMRSRLWDRDEIMAVLKGKKGTRCIKGIVLDFSKKSKFPVRDFSRDEITWNNFQQKPDFKSASAYIKERYRKYLQDRAEEKRQVILQTEQFQPMVGLMLLQINYTKLEGKFKYLPPGLKWLQWKQCPLKNIPSDYCPSELAVLDLSESKIETLWGKHSKKVAEKLMVLNLDSCSYLESTPDLSGYLSLEKIVLSACVKLTGIHDSIGCLSTLVHLNLRNCHDLLELPSDVSGLKRLEDLILSDCWQLTALPKDLSCMVSLRQLLIDRTAIRELPESIFHLTKLEILNANSCRYLKRVPTCIGKLCSLQQLSLNHTALEELPDSVGSLENLAMLSLIGCTSLTVIPDSVRKLISLTQLFLGQSGIKELPASVGSLSYLRCLSVEECKLLVGLPQSVEALASIIELDLSETPITNLPDDIGNMKMLRILKMRKCELLTSLSVTIGRLSALTTLDMYNISITELPESIGMLESLVRFRLDMCKQLRRLPASMGKLRSLSQLLMKETAVTELPESFMMLSSLTALDMERRPYHNMIPNSMPTGSVIPSIWLEEPNSVTILTSFCNLTLLEKLNAHGWRISGKIPDDFEKLSSLVTLDLGYNNICSLPTSMRDLSSLEFLKLPNCKDLTSLPPLPSSLKELNVGNCTALEYIANISHLESLEELILTNCERVIDIPGLEHLKSLKRLYLNGCIGCSSSVKRRISKVLLRKLDIIIMPGSEIPEWFSGDEVCYSKRKNRKLHSVICGGVLSFSHIPDDTRDQHELIDVEAKIFNMTLCVFSTKLRLLGIPKTNEDHIFFRRFSSRTPFVLQLCDGYIALLAKQDHPYVPELELKRCGIYLVLEGDDEYDGDEGSLDESQQSVSQRLANFFNSLADGQ